MNLGVEVGYGEDMRKRSLKKEEIEENNVERLKKKREMKEGGWTCAVENIKWSEKCVVENKEWSAERGLEGGNMCSEEKKWDGKGKRKRKRRGCGVVC